MAAKIEQVQFQDLANFSPKQEEARNTVLKKKYVLYGGAMGGGKSYWLRWELVYLLLRWASKGHTQVNVGLFCEDYPALKDRQISKVAREFPVWLGDFHADHKEHGKCYILKKEFGGGIISFRNLDDPSKYQSAEFAAIAIDEITKNEEATFVDLRTRLRWAGIPDTKFIAATNPGGIGHAWVKKRWIDRQFVEEEEEADLFAYVPAKVADNPHLDPNYIKSLSGLPHDKRRAFLEGDWDIFKGQFFSEWRREVHVINPFEIPENWRKFVCGDYGFSSPSAVYWCAVDGDKRVYVYRELYVRQFTYEMLAQRIVEMTPPNEEIQYWVFDPAIWAKKDSPLSGADLMAAKYREIVGKMPRLIPGQNSRVIGWNAMREKLKPKPSPGGFTADLQVFSTCTNLISTLPSLVYDDTKVEDCDTDGEDHAADAIRYGIMTNPRASEVEPGPRSRATMYSQREANRFYSPFSP